MLRATAVRMSHSFNQIPAVLPKLPFAELHHSKHHATYVANFNKAHEDIQAASQAQDIKKQIALQAAIKFNGGGHINHTLFWENLAPQSQGGGQFPSSGKLHDQVQQDFGGLDGLKKAVNAAALGIQGSGWAWLGYNPTTKKLEAVSTANQDPLLGYVPLKNVKASYLDNIWSVINWQTAEKRLSEA
ncbi:Superoxide dismutase [Mn], mitochondrial [Rhodotorula toruloides]|nr:Superoxide dismutase [Mn], mitochondrial [Rhodotorula toruloides]